MRVRAELVAEVPTADSGAVFWRGATRARETGWSGRQGEGGSERAPPAARAFLDGEESVFVTASNRLVRTTTCGDYVHWAKQFPEDEPVLGAVWTTFVPPAAEEGDFVHGTASGLSPSASSPSTGTSIAGASAVLKILGSLVWPQWTVWCLASKQASIGSQIMILESNLVFCVDNHDRIDSGQRPQIYMYMSYHIYIYIYSDILYYII